MKRVSEGLHFQAAYTWSKTMDVQSATLQDELNTTAVMNPFNPQEDWGPADFDTRHTFTGSFAYLLPFGENLTGASAVLLRGWQVGGILSLSSGVPLTVLSNGAITHSFNRGTARPDLIEGGDPNPVLGGPDKYFDVTQFKPQQAGFYGNVGRNTMIGPRFSNLDMSLIKTQAIGSQAVQFRAEFFNVLNRANFGLPDSTLFDSRGRLLGTAGRITRTVNSARQVQLALRYTF
jgi:hypothetical protein